MAYHSYNRSYFHLFGLLKKHLAGKRFPTDAEMRQAVAFRVPNVDTDFFLRHNARLGATVERTLNVVGG
jgi:hypothetical protein